MHPLNIIVFSIKYKGNSYFAAARLISLQHIYIKKSLGIICLFKKEKKK